MSKSLVVCLAGPPDALAQARETYLEETSKGNVVLGLSALHADNRCEGAYAHSTTYLEALHLVKIAMCDLVLVVSTHELDPDGPLARELAYARLLGKEVRYRYTR